MKRRVNTPEQIVRKLHEADRMLGEGPRWCRSVSTLRSLNRPIIGYVVIIGGCKLIMRNV